ncbi:ATP-binding protein [Halomonas dongshanensis]|uniref:histidine kinase n=1 Tax=Halomonas dongshanensis TaxID=2890835 RepID=A0ABT2ECK5_9GAMM|nr:ATP-binding protein [Halomonas dongshanensis]MCS2609308.1 response regulator [Halomonas dongshanensis]
MKLLVNIARPRLLLFSVLAGLGILGNMVQVSILFNVYFVFGSVAVLLAVVWLGFWPALGVGAITSLYTYLIWDNEVTVLVYLLEASVVAWLFHYRVKNLIIASLLYWLFIAPPLDFLLLPSIKAWSWELTQLVYLKQAINGILCAVIATGVLIVVGLMKPKFLPAVDSLLSLRHLLFCALLSVTLLAGIPPVLYDSHSMSRGQQELIQERLTLYSRQMADYIEGGQPLEALSSVSRDDVSYAVLDAQGNVVAQLGELESLSSSGDTQRHVLNERTALLVPNHIDSASERWLASRYLMETALGSGAAGGQLRVEMSAASSVQEMEAHRTTLLLMLAGVLVLGILTAIGLSRLMTRPLRELGRVGERINQQIASGEPLVLPTSRVVEFQQLASLLERMSLDLSGTFNALRRTQASLEDQVRQRTQALASSNNLLTSVLDGATDFAIIASDLEGRITLFNRGAENMLGYTAEQAIGQQVAELLHDPVELNRRQAELEAQLRRPVEIIEMFTNESVVTRPEAREWHYVRCNGEQVPVKVMVSSIHAPTGEVSGYVGIAEDIRESKRIDTMKREFISTVSHELRTPLTSISGALGMISGGVLGKVPETVQHMVGIAHKNSLRLTHLINDLLDIEKIAVGRLVFDMQRQRLAPLLEASISENQLYRAERNVNLVLTNPHPEFEVVLDAQRFQQVMANLLSNAVKFSPEESEVAIEVTQENDHVVIAVRDCGSGIPEAFKARIFDRFSQVDGSDSRAKGGTGLGLAITRELVRHMNGEIGFESEEGKGSRFWVSFPIVPMPGQVPPSVRPNDARDHVLVVDDDADVCGVLGAMMTQAGYIVDVASDGATALECIERQRYGAVTVDIGLPDMSGFELIRCLREKLDEREVALVVISGRVVDGEVRLQECVDDVIWLMKPVAEQPLLSAITQALEERQVSTQTRPRVLHVEDDGDLHQVIRTMLSAYADVDHAGSLTQAKACLRQARYTTVLLDIRLPDGLGWSLLDEIRTREPQAQVVILSGYPVGGEEQTKVESVLMKSRITPEQLLLTLEQRASFTS